MSNARTITIPTDADVEALLQACKGNATGLRNRAIIDVLRYSGLRVSEALALEPRDVQPDGKGNVLLHVRHGKGGKARHSVLLNGAVDELRRWMDARAALELNATARLFCVTQGKNTGAPLTRAYVDAMLKRLAYDAGLPAVQRVHAHALRHAHATALFRNGAKLGAIQQQLGHAHAITTERYLASLGATDLADQLNGLMA